MSTQKPCFSAGHCSPAFACFAFWFSQAVSQSSCLEGASTAFRYACSRESDNYRSISHTEISWLRSSPKIRPCRQAALPYVLAVRPPAAAHGKAAKGPHSPQPLTGVGSQHLWSVHFSGMGSLCDMRCSYRGVALRGRLCDDQNMLMGGRQGAAAAAPPILSIAE